ncbi:hypothetical protein [Marivivens marinus]|uniref:hypothetical protein n=1 Tax=Marivivens marinus TaxID=3110173 RepID=UPI003B84AD10
MKTQISKSDPIYRRAAFLLGEALQEAKRDQAITYVMRVLSNYAAIGKDAGSGQIKNENLRVSQGALELLGTVESVRAWQRGTINEHPLPLKASWAFILAEAERLTVNDVWEHFAQNPMTTITVEEDSRLNRMKLQSATGVDRYKLADIRVSHLGESPIERLKSRGVK